MIKHNLATDTSIRTQIGHNPRLMVSVCPFRRVHISFCNLHLTMITQSHKRMTPIPSQITH